MQPLICRLIKQVAYEAIRATGELAPHLPEMRHAPVLLDNSTYSPWLSDSYFQIASERVWGYTPRDQLRCYELWSLVQQSKKLGGGALVEVGNWRGDTGCLIAQAAAHFGIPDRVYLCDRFERMAKAELGDASQLTGKLLLDDLVARLRLDNVEVVPGLFPDTASLRITEPAFRFVHIGVDVYQSGKDSLEYLWPRLVSGGIVVFDHYGTYGFESLTLLVNELAPLSDRVFVHNLNGHGVFIKR